MAFEQRSYAGGAVQTTITSDINATDLSINIASSTGWPSGGANGPFFVVIDRGLAGEEKIEIQSRTGTTLTVASTGKRGADDTSASSHTSGASIAHCFTAQDAAEANSHIGNTALDHHTQYHTAARHGAVSHTQAMLASNSVGASQIITGAVGADELADNAVDTGAIVNLAVTTGKIAADAITTAKIADDAITADQLAADAVVTASIVDDAVTTAKLADGAVGATAQIADGIVTNDKLASEASETWTITFDNVTLGTGGTTFARYFKFGRLVFLNCGFRLGSSGANVTGQIRFNLPHPATDVAPGIDNAGWLGAGRAYKTSGATTFSGLGVIADSDGKATAFATAGASAQWNATQPFDWEENDIFQAFFAYEATS